MFRKNARLFLISLAALTVSIVSCKTDVDTDLPYILLDGPNPYYIDSIGGQYIEPGFKGLDDVDGVLTNRIKVDFPVITTDSAKSYEVTYTLTDNSGNTFSTHRTVVVRNTAWFLEGFYAHSAQYCDSDTVASFAASVLASTVQNDQFLIRNFGNFGQNVDIKCTVDRSTGKILIPTPQTLADSSKLISIIADSTYISRFDTLTFQVYFSRDPDTSSIKCTKGFTIFKK